VPEDDDGENNEDAEPSGPQIGSAPHRLNEKEDDMKIPKNDGSGGFWTSNLHPEEDQPAPKPKPEKIIKIRMLCNHGGSMWTADGSRHDLKRGDIIRINEVQGLGLVASGQATLTLDGPMTTEIAPTTREAVKAAKHPAVVAAMQRNQPPKPLPQQVIGSPYRRAHNMAFQGWLGE